MTKTSQIDTYIKHTFSIDFSLIVSMETYTSRTGGKGLLVDGFRFRRQRDTTSSTLIWKYLSTMPSDAGYQIHNFIKTCQFHLAQAWFRKIAAMGLIKEYRDEKSEIRSWLRMFFCTANCRWRSHRRDILWYHDCRTPRRCKMWEMCWLCGVYAITIA